MAAPADEGVALVVSTVGDAGVDKPVAITEDDAVDALAGESAGEIVVSGPTVAVRAQPASVRAPTVSATAPYRVAQVRWLRAVPMIASPRSRSVLDGSSSLSRSRGRTASDADVGVIP
jgi:hypothetical protein